MSIAAASLRRVFGVSAGVTAVCAVVLFGDTEAKSQRSGSESVRDWIGVLIVDLADDGYDLAPTADGVVLALENGSSARVGWTARGSQDAIVGLDLNGNGLVDNVSELLGNRFRKPNGALALNGFDALVQLYLSLGVEKGGLIDNSDHLYPRMLYWVDRNHNGRCEPGEATSLAGAGVVSVATKYSLVPGRMQQTRSGNLIMYKGHVFVSHRGVEFPRELAHIQLAR